MQATLFGTARADPRQSEKAFSLFRDNPRHPSLRVKKMQGREGYWEGRVDQSYRFVFHYETDTRTGESLCVFDDMGPHSVLDK